MGHFCRYIFLFILLDQCLKVFSYFSQVFLFLVADGAAVEGLLLDDVALPVLCLGVWLINGILDALVSSSHFFLGSWDRR